MLGPYKRTSDQIPLFEKKGSEVSCPTRMDEATNEDLEYHIKELPPDCYMLQHNQVEGTKTYRDTGMDSTTYDNRKLNTDPDVTMEGDQEQPLHYSH